MGLLVGAVQRGDALALAARVRVGRVRAAAGVVAAAPGDRRQSRQPHRRLALRPAHLACVGRRAWDIWRTRSSPSDLTMARDFDLGISGPPMSISMDFIAGGLVEMVGGLASAVVLAGYAWWAPLCSPGPGSRPIGCCAKAPSGATATPTKSARRSATPTMPTGSRSIRRPPRSYGCSDWPPGSSSASVAPPPSLRSALAGHAAARAAGVGACCWCSRRTSWCSGRWRRAAADGTLALGGW